jgi:hypothetical protein
MFYGLDVFSNSLFGKESLDSLNRELKVQNRLLKRQEVLYNKSLKEYKDLTDCITVKGTN